MNFRRLINDSKEGLKRKISSRRDNVVMSIEAFQKLSNKYFKQIKEGENLIINVEKEDKEIIIFSNIYEYIEKLKRLKKDEVLRNALIKNSLKRAKSMHKYDDRVNLIIKNFKLS